MLFIRDMLRYTSKVGTAKQVIEASVVVFGKLVYDLSNDAISNDLERTLTLFSKPCFDV